MKDISITDQDHKLWMLLDLVRSAIYKVTEKDLRRFDIMPRQAWVLYVIHVIGDKATPVEISRMLFREPHTISSILNRMEKEGLIRRVKDLDKKNSVRVYMTEKGQQVLDQSLKRDTIHDIMSTLSVEEYRELSSCLNRLLSIALMKLGKEGKLPFLYY